MPNIPKPKPYSKEDFKQDADKFIKGYLGGFDKGEMNQFLKQSVDKIENAGVMSSDEAKDFIKERAFYLKEFAKQNKGETLPQLKADGGRINFRGGDAARSDAASGRSAGRSSPSGGPDDRSSAAQTAAHNAAVAAAQAANKAAKEKMNILDTLNKFRPNTFVNPYDYSVNLNKNIGPFGLNVGINTLGLLGIDDPRTPVDESELDDYGISGGFNTDVLGGNLSLGGGYNPTTGTNFGLSFSKQFNQGGRVNYNEGSLEPDTMALKEKIEEIMDIEGVGFGEAFKQAMRELASQSKE